MTPADLPPLPEPAHEQRVEYEGIARNGIEITPLFDRKQMHAYGKLCARQVLERAVDVAEHWGHDTPSVIRAMIEEYK